jgi:hypothetical protein
VRKPSTYLTPGQVAKLLHRTTKTLRLWRITGEGPTFVSMPHGKVMYRRSAVELYMRDTILLSNNYYDFRE